jgi:hypothetical protein
MQTKIEENRLSVDAVETKFTEWAREERATAQSKIAEWKAKGDPKALQGRADLADATPRRCPPSRHLLLIRRQRRRWKLFWRIMM